MNEHWHVNMTDCSQRLISISSPLAVWCNNMKQRISNNNKKYTIFKHHRVSKKTNKQKNLTVRVFPESSSRASVTHNAAVLQAEY